MEIPKDDAVKLFNEIKSLHETKTKPNFTYYMDAGEYKAFLNEIKCAKSEKDGHKSDREYYLLRHYDIMNVNDDELIVDKEASENDIPKCLLTIDKFYEVLDKIHKQCGHGGRDRMQKEVFKIYSNITLKVINIYLKNCIECTLKKKKKQPVELVVKPIVSDNFDSRLQIDLVDMQSCKDGDYKWILNAQNHHTKMVHLRALKSKTAAEVAINVFDIFINFGAPLILQSDNGREFVAEVINELAIYWPDLKIVHGAPRKPQIQGSVERANGDVNNNVFLMKTGAHKIRQIF
jgi:hypothetical protein